MILGNYRNVIVYCLWQHDHHNLPWEEAMMWAVSTLVTQKSILTEDLVTTKNNSRSPLIYGSCCETYPSEG